MQVENYGRITCSSFGQLFPFITVVYFKGPESHTTPNSNLTSYDMMGIMNGKSPELLYLPNGFLPTKKNQINEKHGKTICTYAGHSDRSLPEKNPNDSQMDSLLKRINMFYEEVNDNLTKCLLSHLMVGCNIFQWCIEISSVSPSAFEFR